MTSEQTEAADPPEAGPPARADAVGHPESPRVDDDGVVTIPGRYEIRLRPGLSARQPVAMDTAAPEPVDEAPEADVG